jgi:hypothetical protein
MRLFKNPLIAGFVGVVLLGAALALAAESGVTNEKSPTPSCTAPVSPGTQQSKC